MSTTGNFYGTPLSSLAADTSPPYSSASTYVWIEVILIILLVILASAIIVFVILLIYLLLQFLYRIFSIDHEISFSNHHVVPTHLLDSLPTGGDCAVCLSKLETHDEISLLPLCCHAFHSQCIGTWIASNQTCPLCRSTVFPSESDILDMIRVELVSVSRRHGPLEYAMDGDGHEVSVGSIRRSWLREYVDRIVSSRTLLFRVSERFFGGGSSQRRDDLEANMAGEEITTAV